MSKGSTETVKVMVRVRPMNSKEIAMGCQRVVMVDKATNQITLRKPDSDESIPSKDFTYDAVYDVDSQQQPLYDESGFPLVESVIKGYNGTIFAYGQTGCGKTHTMLGVPTDPNLRGIIPNCFEHIFGFIDEKCADMKFLVRCSYLEIYNEEIHDLLVESKKIHNKLELKEDPNKGVFVKDLTCCIIKSIPEIEKAMNYGTANRKTASTNMNQDSSRSHSLFTIYIETAEAVKEGKQMIKAGKLNLVDLAGSERSSKTGATGQTLKEGIKINLSLTALGNVISSLVDGKSAHIPYRDSKLTRLLQDSLGGNTKTVMIAACSPADYNYEETLSTLRYAARAKAIKNKPRVNEDPKDALLKEYELEIRKLKQMLEDMNKGINPNQNGTVVDSLQRWETAGNIKMDLEGSIGKNKNNQNQANNKEESVEDLIKKLQNRGTRVKILKEDEENQTPKQSGSKKAGSQMDVLNDRTDGLNQRMEQPDNIQDLVDNQPQDEGDDRKMVNADDLEELARQKQEIAQQKQQQEQVNDQLQNELMTKEQALENEKRQKEELATLIQEMEKKLVSGGHGLDENDDEKKDQIRKERLLQKQLKKQKKKEQALLEEKMKKEEEMLFVQGNYTSLQQEVESMRDIMEKLRSKYKGAESEINDLTKEHQQQKSELLDIIRSQEKAVKFSNKVMGILLSENELQKLHQRSKWDDERGDWTIPMFTFNHRTKDIAFPTINAKQRVEQGKEERELRIQGDAKDDDDISDSQFRRKGNFNARTKKSQKPPSRNQISMATGQQHHNYSGMYNHSADENSNENNRKEDTSWIGDRFSQDNNSNNNFRDSHSNGPGNGSKSKNITGAGSVNSLTNQKAKSKNDMIPERRRKYLNGNNGASDDQAIPGQQQLLSPSLAVESSELLEDNKNIHRKNNKNMVHLQPLDHQPQARNSSVPPMSELNQLTGKSQGAPHPLNFAPSPNQRGGNNIRLESIDHSQHQINYNQI